MIPITELRLSIPYFIIFENVPWETSLIFSVLGNIFIGVIILYIIAPIMMILSKINYFSRIIIYILNRTKSRSKLINQFKLLGLIIFIGIPMPFTGVWTGSLASYLLCISKKKAIFGIILGVLISSIIVTSLTVFGSEVWHNMIQSELNKKLGLLK